MWPYFAWQWPLKLFSSVKNQILPDQLGSSYFGRCHNGDGDDDGGDVLRDDRYQHHCC